MNLPKELSFAASAILIDHASIGIVSMSGSPIREGQDTTDTTNNSDNDEEKQK